MHACMETLIPELVKQNASLNLGFVTINPSGQISMMNMETPPPGHARVWKWSHKKANLTVRYKPAFISRGTVKMRGKNQRLGSFKVTLN